MTTISTVPGTADEVTRITVVGEALVDVIGNPSLHSVRTYPGGSPLNVAVGLARLDIKTDLVTHYAEDPHGRALQRHLQSNGVRVIRGGSAPTSTATATVGLDGGATYTFDVSWDPATAWSAAASSVGASAHVHTGSIASVMSPGVFDTLALVQAARKTSTISFDPNCRPSICPDLDVARDHVERFVESSDIVKASDEDLRWLYPHSTPEAVLRNWLERGPAVVALTMGGAGPLLLTRNSRVKVPAETIIVADTVGAGDSFMAGLISGLAQFGALGDGGRRTLHELTSCELQDLAVYANRAAAITCSRSGANPPYTTELGRLGEPAGEATT